jgi:bifunctional DNase/RNase
MRSPVRLLWVVLTAGLIASPALADPNPSEKKPAEREVAKPSAAPDGFVEMFVAGVLPTEGGPAVVLRDKTEKTLIPIWIGASEAHSIQLRLERRRFPRPLTHDLLDAIMHDLGGELVKIHVDDLKGDTFVGTVFVRRGDHLAHFDARPSDSIALAVGNAAPIFVSKAVIDRIAASRKEGDKESASKGEGNESETAPKDPTPSHAQTL